MESLKTKKELRETYLKIRNEILNPSEKSEIITRKILNSDSYKNAKVIGIYKSFSSEVDTTLLIEEALKEKIVAVPIVKNKKMFFSKIEKETKYRKNKFGIEEPIQVERIDKIDLLITPGVCFDKEKNRIGYGGGYYDRYIEEKDIDSIAICFEEQIYKGIIPKDKNDVKVKKIITNKSTYK